jgi:prepilin-type N-terminal cleavage/methylation domain-containing protein
MQRQNAVSRRRGFTLIELLVVISIILIASSIIFIGGNGGDGPALTSSQRIVSGIAQGARGQAILKNAETRLIIHNDPSELDKYRRFFGIVYFGEDVDNNGNVTATGWKAATQGTYLPEGIFFDAASSANTTGSSWTTTKDLDLDYPRATVGNNTDRDNGGGGESYFYYGFNSNGTALDSNAYLILAAGTMIPDATGELVDRIAVEPNQEGLRAGLIFRRAGTTTQVNELTAIPVSGSSTAKEIK